jgi:hypothetical protein
LKPYVRSFFGQVKNSAWKVVEESIDIGEQVALLHELLRFIRSMRHLSSSWLLFNAFIFGLLNDKALDFWLTHLHAQKSILCRHYTSAAFMSLTGSGLVAHRLFVDLITAVQPLAQLPFHLEYDFETRRLERLRCKQVTAAAATDLSGGKGLMEMHSSVSAHQSVYSSDGDGVDVTHRLRSVLGRFGNTATQSLVLAKNALQATSVTSTTTVRPPRPLSLPANLLDFSDDLSSHGDSDLVFDSSSADSVDSSGFFRRFAEHLKTVAAPRESSAYRHGVTDYSFGQSPEAEITKSDNLLTQPSSGNVKLESRITVPLNTATTSQNQSATPSNCAKVSLRKTHRPESIGVNFAGPAAVSCSVSESTHGSPKTVNSNAKSKRWSDFGTRLVGFVDKILLPDIEKNRQQASMAESECQLNVNRRRSYGEFSQVRQLIGPQDGGCVGRHFQDKVNSFDGTLQCIAEQLQQNETNSLVQHVDKRLEKYVLTLCHCVASDNEQLSFEKGTRLVVLSDTEGSDWLLCRHDSRDGLVHRACVKILP